MVRSAESAPFCDDEGNSASCPVEVAASAGILAQSLILIDQLRDKWEALISFQGSENFGPAENRCLPTSCLSFSLALPEVTCYDDRLTRIYEQVLEHKDLQLELAHSSLPQPEASVENSAFLGSCWVHALAALQFGFDADWRASRQHHDQIGLDIERPLQLAQVSKCFRTEAEFARERVKGFHRPMVR